jgi:hypothetical protein
MRRVALRQGCHERGRQLRRRYLCLCSNAANFAVGGFNLALAQVRSERITTQVGRRAESELPRTEMPSHDRVEMACFQL